MGKSLVLGLVSLGTVSTSSAQLIWTGDQDFIWSTNNAGNTNWDTNTLPASTDTVQFGATAPGTITLGGANRTVAGIQFLSTATTAFTLNTGSNRVIINSTAGVVVQAGSANHFINATGTDIALQVASTTNTSFDIAAGTQLTISRVDFNNRGITKLGDGILTVNPNTSIASNLAVNAGTLELTGNLGNGGTSGSGGLTGSGTITASGGTRTLHVLGRGTPLDSTFSGSIQSTINLVKGRTEQNDTGTLTLTGTNTYSGTTIARTGTIRVMGTHTGGDNYSINGHTTATTASGVLAGTGTIVLADNTKTFSIGDGDVDGSSGVLYPGADNTDTGVLTLGSSGINTSVNFNTDGILRLDIGASGNSDRVNIFGNLDLSNSGDTLELLSLAGAWGGSTYTIATFTGTLSGTFNNVIGLDSGYVVNYLGNSITLSAIPEPSTYLLLGGGLAMIYLLRRRTKA
ncbi:MAG: PEP-CTERM sorting domain-containing protein [Blastochloris sp.]|nr:PEP-CTERM sorting domain-containing protein [Blastochloris sp.]